MKTLCKRKILLVTAVLLSSTAFAQRNSNSTISTNNNGKTVEMSLQNDQITALSIDGKKIPQGEWKNYSDLVNTTLSKVKTDNEHAKKDRERATQDRIQAAKDRDNAATDRKRAEGDLLRAKEDRARASVDRANAAKDRERATEDRRVINSLTTDLVADHIIKDAESLHDLEITETGISVNKVKQSDALFKKYSAKYGNFTGRKFSYTFHQENN